ncbi:MAG TPA: twin-arginine translocase TatA/TatE family subunit [Miltoncostaeaceae bacterium]|nr:twin-arginine translocase TatA/TatE family subunit [Miltoncostaeaceae bacterium]
MFDPSPMHVVVLIVILVLVFGPKRLPELGRGLGKGIREFRSGLHRGAEAEGPADDDEPPPGAAT